MESQQVKLKGSTIKFGKSQKLVSLLQVLKAADHEGYRHSAFDWWIFVAMSLSPKTCENCLVLDMTDWRGDWIPDAFPYHEHRSADLIKAKVHPNCRCVLRWAGRSEELYKSPLSFDIKSMWQPSKAELERMTPEELRFALNFLRNPWR